MGIKKPDWQLKAASAISLWSRKPDLRLCRLVAPLRHRAKEASTGSDRADQMSNDEAEWKGMANAEVTAGLRKCPSDGADDIPGQIGPT